MANFIGKSVNLTSLSGGMPGLTSAHGTMLAEAAAVCLEDRAHQAGVALRLSGMTKATFAIEWPAVNEQQRRSYNDIQEATEHGACGLAILIVKELTGHVVVERSKKGPGFDYWLGEDDDRLFAGKARLEVSGILSGTASQVDARVKEKKKQTEPSSHLAPGYEVVVEFGRPLAHVEIL